MRYIDAEKLKAEIERLLAKAENDEKTAFKKKDAAGHLAAVTKTAVCVKIKKLITSLQQEQTEFPKTNEEVEKFLATAPNVELPKKYENPDWLFKKQEQSEVGLEKFTEKIKTFQGRYKYPEIVSIKGAMAFMARMFYQYPNVARQWYDSLPKATMD